MGSVWRALGGAVKNLEVSKREKTCREKEEEPHNVPIHPTIKHIKQLNNTHKSQFTDTAQDCPSCLRYLADLSTAFYKTYFEKKKK